MSETEPDNIVLRYLRKLDERTKRIEENQNDMAADIRILKGHMSSFMQSEIRHDGMIASMQVRLERLERRLDLADASAE